MNGNEVNLWAGLGGFPNKILPGGYVMGTTGERGGKYAYQDQLDLAQDIVTTAGADYTQLLLSEDLYPIAAQISGTPTAFFVDSTGNQVGYAYSGAMDQEQWSQILDEVLAEAQE